jgi:hypothetical protein
LPTNLPAVTASSFYVRDPKEEFGPREQP